MEKPRLNFDARITSTEILKCHALHDPPVFFSSTILKKIVVEKDVKRIFPRSLF